MRTIHKYPIPDLACEFIAAPWGAKPRFFGYDGNDQLCLWCEVDTRNPIAPLSICIVGTGHEIPSAHTTYVGSVVKRGYVWHLYTL